MSNIIKGRWRWNDVVYCKWQAVHKEYDIAFKCNAEAFRTIFLDWSVGYHYLTYIDVNSNYVLAGKSQNEGDDFYSVDEAYRIMDFGETDQLIDDGLYNFISENAEPYLAPLTIAEKLAVIAENEQKVYDKGYKDGTDGGFEKGYEDGFDKGKAEGYQEGLVSGEAYEKGKQAEYDAFWDAYQVNGNRGTYEGAFAGQGWNDKSFNPKYPIVVTGSSWNMFYSCNVKDGYEHLKNVDFSKCTLLNNTFSQCHMKHLGTIDCRNVKSVSQVFYHAKSLQTIDKIIVKVENTFSSLFDNTPLLENVTFEGEIGNNLVMAGTYSGTKWGEKLTRASIESIVNHLSDNVSGKLTLSKSAVDREFEGYHWVEELQDTSWGEGSISTEWKELIAPAVAAGWKISLV